MSKIKTAREMTSLSNCTILFCFLMFMFAGPNMSPLALILMNMPFIQHVARSILPPPQPGFVLVLLPVFYLCRGNESERRPISWYGLLSHCIQLNREVRGHLDREVQGKNPQRAEKRENKEKMCMYRESKHNKKPWM